MLITVPTKSLARLRWIQIASIAFCAFSCYNKTKYKIIQNIRASYHHFSRNLIGSFKIILSSRKLNPTTRMLIKIFCYVYSFVVVLLNIYYRLRVKIYYRSAGTCCYYYKQHLQNYLFYNPCY